VLRFITDKRHFIWVPIHAYLLEHPREGLVLIDAGICPEQAHQHSRYYTGLMRLFLMMTSMPRSLKRHSRGSSSGSATSAMM
jgi:hypothetical protein